MKNIKIEVSLEELLLATTLMSDQLFRREFIDPKMPGYKGDPTELARGKELVQRLKGIVKQAAGTGTAVSRRSPSHFSAHTNGVADAI